MLRFKIRGLENFKIRGLESLPPTGEIIPFTRLSLPISTRLGPYEILGSLGAGGMGEVYKARDTRIDRSVAIKILPGGASRTSDAESRFEREARALAALSHPRICSLFEFTRIDGEALLIMEYLEGQLLSERLTKGRLTLPDALRIAVEMADGLAAATAPGWSTGI